MMGDATTVAGGINLSRDIRRYVVDIVWSLAKASVDRQEKILAKHPFDDIFRWTNHIIVLVSSLYLGEHHLVDVKGLVDDPYLLARLLLIPFREVGKHILVNIVCPVIYFQYLLSVFSGVLARRKE